MEERLQLPSARRTQASPLPPQSFTGVLIAAPAVVPYTGRIVVSGVYMVPEKEAARIDAHLHRALVSVVTCFDTFSVANPFRDAVLFDDDDDRSDWGRLGYFHFNALPGRPQLYLGEHYINVSLGRYLSNTLCVVVR